MTTTAMIAELKASLGNRTDLSDARYVRWLNWSLYDICGFHRKRLFPPKKFHELEEDTYFKTDVRSNLVGSSISASTLQVTSGDSEAANDFYNGMVVKLTSYSGTEPTGLLNQTRVIVDYVGSSGSYICTIAPDWAVNPDTNTTYTIYRRKYHLTNDIGVNARTSVYAVERMEKAENGNPLQQDKWTTVIGNTPTEIQEPTRFARRGNSILFNTQVLEEEWYRMYYYRLPVELNESTGSISCELPEEWHEAVVLGAIWRGFEKLMEPLRSSEAKKRYVDLATNKLDEFTIEEANITRGFKVKR